MSENERMLSSHAIVAGLNAVGAGGMWALGHPTMATLAAALALANVAYIVARAAGWIPTADPPSP